MRLTGDSWLSFMFVLFAFIPIDSLDPELIKLTRPETGNKPQMRIVNGAHAAPGAFPWQLQLQRNRKKHCGATLISDKWALTAAHCISHKENLQVMAGSNHWNEGQRMRVLSTLIHPQYDKRRFLNDIALLRLELVGNRVDVGTIANSPMLLGSLHRPPLLGQMKRPIGTGARSGPWRSGGGFGRLGRRSAFWNGRFSNRTDDQNFNWRRRRMWRSLEPTFRSSSSDRWSLRRLHRNNRYFRPLSFRRQSSFQDEIILRTFRALPASIKIPESYMQFKGTATVTGWGLVSELDRKGSDYLQAANVNLLTSSACRNYKNFEEETQICAGYENGGTDACAGDSGGGLVTMVNDVAYLIGVVSYGLGCGRKNFPGVYTKVSYYRDWIQSETGI